MVSGNSYVRMGQRSICICPCLAAFAASELTSPILATNVALSCVTLFHFSSFLQFSVMLTSSTLLLLVARYLNLYDAVHCISAVAPCLYWQFWILFIALGACWYYCSHFLHGWETTTTSPMQVNYSISVHLFFIGIYHHTVEHNNLSNQGSMLIVFKIKLQVLSNLHEITANPGRNWEEATLWWIRYLSMPRALQMDPLRHVTYII